MIDLRLSIKNPWHDTRKNDGWYRDTHHELTKNKSIEFEIDTLETSNLLSVRFSVSWRGEDHAGIRASIGLLRLSASFNLYDNRHWNYDENRWNKYGEDD